MRGFFLCFFLHPLLLAATPLPGIYLGLKSATSMKVEISADQSRASIELKMGVVNLLVCKDVPFRVEPLTAPASSSAAGGGGGTALGAGDAERIVLDEGRLQTALREMMALRMVQAVYGEVKVEGIETRYFPTGKDGTGLPSVMVQVKDAKNKLILSITGSYEGGEEGKDESV